jgi:general secretion pathway protein K
MSRRGERGLALIVVLWGVAALSLIAFAMLSSSMNAARIGHNAWAQIELETAADSAVQGSIYSLFDTGNPQAFDGTPRTTDAGGIQTTVAIQDESGIDLNQAGRDLLAGYFKGAGVEDADALAGRVVARRAQAPFQAVEDLAQVDGMTAELFARLAPGLTVYSHRTSLDLRTAPVIALKAIAGMTDAGAAATIAMRHPIVAHAGEAFSITATTVRGAMRFERRAVVLITRDPARPYWILAWD